MSKYRGVNEGNREFSIRLGCERDIYNFVTDYAVDMGMSRSSVVRRLMLIGARCELEHGGRVMPASYDKLRVEPKDIETDPFLDLIKRKE